ncbi:hypothetical protein PHYPSEUDO_013723 [Phytophthora pseudosyringae]|uniref:Alcohol dehydrogenase-like C-terminal domain-containing protein n=1 Tax=Phytophthora pseudosyringae TaxID=221518 RepID=A0A8T1V5W6_9STRA|nr:hypothetical protein PHYPSEUDO_013723 [Phytophthora pseudosyringae]
MVRTLCAINASGPTMPPTRTVPRPRGDTPTTSVLTATTPSYRHRAKERPHQMGEQPTRSPAFTPMKQEGVKAGDRVGVIGIGGLGHLAIQFIRAFGATPVAFSRSANKEKEIYGLGAEEFYNLSDPKDQKKEVGSV